MQKINYRYRNHSLSFTIIKNHPIDLGVVIRNARKKNFMTQQEVADEIEISVKLYQKYEYNVCRPSLETVFKIFNLLGVSANELQQKLKGSSALSSLNIDLESFTTEEFIQKVVRNPHLFKVNEALLRIECPECLELIAIINNQFSVFKKSELKRKLIMLKKLID